MLITKIASLRMSRGDGGVPGADGEVRGMKASAIQNSPNNTHFNPRSKMRLTKI